jgi:hypothetical protein
MSSGEDSRYLCTGLPSTTMGPLLTRLWPREMQIQRAFSIWWGSFGFMRR